MSAGVVAWSTSSFGKESDRTLTADEVKQHLAGVVGLVAGTEKLTGEILRGVPGLKCISRVGVGMDAVDIGACKELGIAVVNTPEAHVDAVAELTLAGLLALLRKVPQSDASIRDGKFDKPMGRLLRGKTVGMVGFGRVGRALAKLLAPFETEIVAYVENLLRALEKA